MINRLIEFGRKAPEGRFKEFVRSLLSKYYDPLDALVTGVEMLPDGSLFVELNNGVRFSAQRDRAIRDGIDNLSPRRYRSGHGKRHLLAETGAIGSFISLWFNLREIYVRNIYEEYYKLKKGDIVVDLGANMGLFTVKAAKAVGDEGIVIAIEPEVDNLRFLERNVMENEVGNVVIVPKGVWSGKDRLKLFISGFTGHHSLLHCEDKNRFVEVEVDTVDNILRELGVKKVDFIKMDIEGAEIEACKGMKQTLKDNDVKLAIDVEVSHIEGANQTDRIIASWLNRSGFEVCVKKGIVYGMKKPSLSS